MPIATIETEQLTTVEAFKDLGAGADAFEHYPNPHAKRIAAIADQIAKSFQLGARDRFSLRIAALAPDLGAQLLVRWHHEWWNGNGYPDGLRFEQIPLGARILRVADTYASLTDARPFRKAYSERQAREHLLEWTGLEFDPRVVRALLSLEPFKELKGYGREEEVPADLSAIANEMMTRVEALGS